MPASMAASGSWRPACRARHERRRGPAALLPAPRARARSRGAAHQRGRGRGEESPLVSVDPHTVAPNPEQPRRARSIPMPSQRSVTRSACTACSIRSSSSAMATPTVSWPVSGVCVRLSSPASRASRRSSARPRSPAATQLEMALTENLLRTDLNPMEEAAAYARLSDAFGLTHEAIALRLGRSRSGIIERHPAARPPGAGPGGGRRLTPHRRPRARAARRCRSPSIRRRWRPLVIADGLSVRETERAVQEDWLRLRRRIGSGHPLRLRHRPRPTTSRCDAASSRHSAFPSACSAARVAAAGSSSTGPTTPTWTRSIGSWAARALTPRTGRRDQPTGRSAAPVRRASAASASKLARKASMYFGRSAGL